MTIVDYKSRLLARAAAGRSSVRSSGWLARCRRTISEELDNGTKSKSQYEQERRQAEYGICYHPRHRIDRIADRAWHLGDRRLDVGRSRRRGIGQDYSGSA